MTVPLERLMELETQFLPMLPENQAGSDLRTLVLEAIAATLGDPDPPQVRHLFALICAASRRIERDDHEVHVIFKAETIAQANDLVVALERCNGF